ncbi:MAG: TetR/AcrR family transcriptional regulator [Acidimicrobiia bacterium]|nr:TetR/AcrR family transcriptional regulator [Acidimicrobiia bacterium]
MQNAVPDGATLTEPLDHSVAARTLRDRADVYAEEVRRLLDAAYAVMRRTGTLDPRVSDIVAESGLSNQAFYRHFRGKNELLLAVLDDGQRRLVSYLEARLARVDPGAPRVRAWIEGVLEQARNPEAAANTKPFTANSARLATEFPDESAQSREQVVALLRAALVDAGGNPRHDADAIYHLAMGRAGDAIARGEVPTNSDVDHLVEFALRGIGAM